MKKSMLKKLLCGFLAVLMLTGTSSFAVSAADETVEKSELEEIKAILDTLSYSNYFATLTSEGAKRATEEFTVTLAEKYDAKASDATGVEVYDAKQTNEKYGKEKPSILLPSEGTVTFKITVPSSGFYTIDMEYYAVEAKATSIERMLYIDGQIPFSEARYLEMTKTWVDLLNEEGGFDVDITGNDIRPGKDQIQMWRTYTARDSSGFIVNPLQFYFEKGEHTVSLEAVREPVLLTDMRFYPYEDLLTYEDALAEWQSKGYEKVNDASVRVEGEKPIYVSDQTVYPLNDRTSPISYPQDPSLIKLNTIGADKWKNAGQWIEYEVEVSEKGLYELALRYKQSTLEGMYVSRRIYINEEIPFEEASYIEFNYSDGWQSGVVSDKNGTPYQFPLKEGKNIIKFEVVLGSMSEVLNRVNNSLTLMNNAYLKIMMITGSSPDQYRDYNFGRLIPESINDLVFAGKELKEVSKLLVDITGQKGSHVATLDKIVVLLERMTSDEDEVAKNLTNLKTYIGTLGTWLLDSRSQPLEIDYFVFQSSGKELPTANANFFATFWFEFRSFLMSFFTDYSTLGATTAIDDENKVEVWTTSGREKSSILRQLIDRDFMPNYNIAVELKLVSGGVLQSTLAGIGPDIAFLPSEDCVNYAIRDAVLPLNDMEGFDEVVARFPESSMTTLSLYGKTYGLPNTTTFLMMFYRMDILAELGLEVPKTWDDLKDIIPVLQNNNMTIGFPSKITGTKLFLYQKGGEMYADDGKRINLSSNVALDAFKELTDLFQSYRFELTYDFPNRFRTGEMPIGIADYISNYNQLTVFAPEIDGLWEFAPLPGFINEDGKLNNRAVVTVQGVCLMRGALDNKEASWKFLEWYTQAETQANYSNELVAIVGQSSKNATSNTEALEQLPWSAREYSNLEKQFNNTVGITEYPGGYIISRYVEFAFLDVYNDGANSTEAMLEYVTEINKEITRKRKEFDFEYLDINYQNSSEYIEAQK